MVELEEKYIDKMFEMGDLENLTKYDLKFNEYLDNNESKFSNALEKSLSRPS